MQNIENDLLWKNISSLPYFRGFLRAIEGRYYDDIELSTPLLDLGIGDGHFSATTLPGIVDVGIDPAFKSLREAKTFSAARILSCAKGDKLPFKENYFSTVISNSVLEHIEDLEPVLGEVHRILKTGGYFVICVPNAHFTQNLSIALVLNKLRMFKAAIWYQGFFNKISRHYHPDSVEKWNSRLEKAGFSIIRSWNYFPARSLSVLEWGHVFGIPSWVNKKLFGKWILIPKRWNIWLIYNWLHQYYEEDQTDPDGAYSFFIMTKG
jgi:SAM-dependent methyltransferase